MATIKQLMAHSKTYTKGRANKRIEYIVVHYTGSNASARNNCVYFSGGNRGASAHYFIDNSDTIWQSVADKDTAWAVGNFDLNQRSISIEVVSAGQDFTDKEINNLAWLVGRLQATYGIDDAHVIRHYDAVDVSTTGRTLDPHKQCPKAYVNASKWKALKSRICKGSKHIITEPESASKPRKLEVDGVIGKNSVQALQSVLGSPYTDGVISRQPKQWAPHLKAITAIRFDHVPGDGGSDLVRRMQKAAGASVDGLFGIDTVRAWQKLVGVPMDGYFGQTTARATQRWLNERY